MKKIRFTQTLSHVRQVFVQGEEHTVDEEMAAQLIQGGIAVGVDSSPATVSAKGSDAPPAEADGGSALTQRQAGRRAKRTAA